MDVMWITDGVAFNPFSGYTALDIYYKCSTMNDVDTDTPITTRRTKPVGEITPTDRELDILKILWRHGPTTVRDVWRKLSRAGRELAYTTVLSLLQTMEKKGLVGHEAAGKAYVYSSAASREQTIRGLAARFLEKVFDGAVDEYLVHAMKPHGLSLEQLDRLQAVIAEARKRHSQGRPDKGDRP